MLLLLDGHTDLPHGIGDRGAHGAQQARNERRQLALGEGGLMVDGVQDDGLAAACGLQPDDIVTKIGGRAIASPADVAAALGGIQKGAEVRVEFVRRGRPQVATTAKRHDAPAGRAPLPRKVDASGARTEIKTIFNEFDVGSNILFQYLKRVLKVSSFWGSDPPYAGYHALGILGRDTRRHPWNASGY